MAILDDGLDKRAKQIIASVNGKPSEQLLRRAALIEEAPSPVMLEDTAEWIEILDKLEVAGFTPEQRMLLAAHGSVETLGRHPPGLALLIPLFACDAGLALARSICEEQLSHKGGRPWEQQFRVNQHANVALVRLAASNAIEPRFDRLFQWHPIDPTALRTIMSALPLDRREALVGSKINARMDARFILDNLLWIVDLVPGVRARFDELLAKAQSHGDHARLAADVARGAVRPLEKRPTAEANKALAYWLGDRAKTRRAREIGPIATKAHARRIAIAAPELATTSAWTLADHTRQREIAVLVVEALAAHTKERCKLVEIATFGGSPIAVIACGKRRFSLVPGGTSDIGLSKNEEKAVRSRGKNMRDGSHERLLAKAERMRPLTRVSVGPLLVMQGPGEEHEPDAAADALEASRFRVPSEAEWEYLARGGREHQLTYRNNAVPDDAQLFVATRRSGPKTANAFGLWGFGFEPELCADAWSESLATTPTDGSPRKGAGDRVVRGGGARSYPWQGSDEWHLLLNANRVPQSADVYCIALRFVLTIDIAAKKGELPASQPRSTVAGMGFSNDDSVDDRTHAILIENRQPVTDDLLERATHIEEAPSPAMLEDTALWLRVVDAFRAANFTTREMLLGCTRGTLRTRQLHSVTSDLLAHVLSPADGVAVAREVCDELLPRAGTLVFREQLLANVALGRLAVANEIEPRFDALFDLYPNAPTQLRAIIGALPMDRRAQAVLAHASPSRAPDVNVARNAAFKLDSLLAIADLVPNPSVKASYAKLLAAATKDKAHAGLAAEIAAGTPRPSPPSRPTPKALDALAYWRSKTTTAKGAGDINALAERTWPERRLELHAPELATVDAWKRAGAKRQKQIASAVAAALSERAGAKAKVVDIATFGGPQIAIIELAKQRYCLLPGGTLEMGFSEEEEAAVRAQAEVNAGCDNHFELYESLFANVDTMRPIVTVHVGPLLVAQGPGKVFDLDQATKCLAESVFHLPSEAEWEYLARGGKLRELTYRGDVVPDTADAFRETSKLGVKSANAFGLWGFGLEPELCADVYFGSHDDATLDGSPRCGPGDRVARGGAGQLFPWQDTGEWHLMLNAMRAPATMWEFAIALRFVMRID